MRGAFLNAGNPDPRAASRQRKSQLRKELRKLRHGIPAIERSAACSRICENIRRVPAFRSARHVASFIAFDGEPSLAGLHQDQQARTKQFYVPVIQAQRMQFAPLADHLPVRTNSFGIIEPNHRRRIRTQQLDIVLVSLVGFDERGNRLGMGGGYYDRHFSFLKTRRDFMRPRLIGVAYEVQCVENLPVDPWDVPLWGIVTDRGFRATYKELPR